MASSCRQRAADFAAVEGKGGARRSLTFTWRRGAASLAELGDPTVSTEIALCVYDASGRALATASQAGSAWEALGASGYRLRDASGGAGGLTQLRLKPSGGTRASMKAKGKGTKLPELALSLVPPVTAQLVSSDGGVCWQGVYPAGGSTRSTASLFRGHDG